MLCLLPRIDQLTVNNCSSCCYFVSNNGKLHAKMFFIDLPIGYVKVVEMLIERGADLNIVNDDGNGPITVAAKAGNISNECFVFY